MHVGRGAGGRRGRGARGEQRRSGGAAEQRRSWGWGWAASRRGETRVRTYEALRCVCRPPPPTPKHAPYIPWLEACPLAGTRALGGSLLRGPSAPASRRSIVGGQGAQPGPVWSLRREPCSALLPGQTRGQSRAEQNRTSSSAAPVPSLMPGERARRDSALATTVRWPSAKCHSRRARTHPGRESTTALRARRFKARRRMPYACGGAGRALPAAWTATAAATGDAATQRRHTGPDALSAPNATQPSPAWPIPGLRDPGPLRFMSY